MRLLALSLTLALPSAAQALNCGPHTTLAEALAASWGETRQGMGLASDGRIVEVYANLSSGSFSFVTSDPSGVACIVAAGEGWVADYAPPEVRQGEPA